jgi:hypothetical protein
LDEGLEAVKSEVTPKAAEEIKGIERAELNKASSAPNGSHSFEKVNEETKK